MEAPSGWYGGRDPILCIPGTHDYTGTEADAGRWWFPGNATHPPSPWVQEARRRGLVVLGDPGAPFVWSSDLDGAWPRWLRRSSALTTWKAAGEAVREYCWARGVRRVQLVAWSHGGQVGAYAAARRLAGFRVSTLLTLGMPIRGDMRVIYKAARATPDVWWEAIYSEGWGDPWQLAGELWDGTWGWRRANDWACHNTPVPGVGHGDLVKLEVWNREKLWRFLLA
jgi:hypothetical protein